MPAERTGAPSLTPEELVRYQCFSDSLHRMSNLVTTMAVASSNIALVVKNLQGLHDRLAPLTPRLANLDRCAHDLVTTLETIRHVGRFDAGATAMEHWQTIGCRLAIANADALAMAGWTLDVEAIAATSGAVPALAAAELVLMRLVAINAAAADRPSTLCVRLVVPEQQALAVDIDTRDNPVRLFFDSATNQLAQSVDIRIAPQGEGLRLYLPRA